MGNDLLIENVDYFTCEINYFCEVPSEMGELKNTGDRYHVFLLLEGNVDYQIGNNTYCLNTNHVAIAKPDTEYKLILPDHSELNEIFRRIEFTFKLSSDKRYDDIRKLLDGYELLNIFDNKELIHWEHSVQQFYNIISERELEFCKNGFVTQFVVLLFYFYNQETKREDVRTFKNRHELVIHILAFIEQDLISISSLSYVAEKFHVNPSYLSRIFKEDVGMSFSHYVTFKRLELAKTLIGEGDRPMVAAYKTGFNDYSWFYKKFKEQYGISPTAYFKKRLV